MNEFTKEELENLKWCVRQAQAHNKPKDVTSMAYVDGFVPMIKKIQSMIDNYCENPWIDRNEIWPCNIEKVEFMYDDKIAVGTADRDSDGNHINHGSYIIEGEDFDPRLITHWRGVNE